MSGEARSEQCTSVRREKLYRNEQSDRSAPRQQAFAANCTDQFPLISYTRACHTWNCSAASLDVTCTRHSFAPAHGSGSPHIRPRLPSVPLSVCPALEDPRTTLANSPRHEHWNTAQRARPRCAVARGETAPIAHARLPQIAPRNGTLVLTAVGSRYLPCWRAIEFHLGRFSGHSSSVPFDGIVVLLLCC